MKFRIKKYERGYVVEVQQVKRVYILFKKYYWTHYISAAGLETIAWYHSEYKYAMMNLLDKVENETNKNSR